VADPATGGDRWAVAGLALLTAGWHLGFRRLGIDETRVGLTLVYLVGLFTLWFAPAGLHPAYFSLLLVMYPQVFRHLRLTLSVPAAVALTVEVVWREVLASGRPLSENLPAIAGGLVSVVFGSLFAFWLTRIIDQRDRVRPPGPRPRPQRRPRPAGHARAGRGPRRPPGRGERPRPRHHHRRHGAGRMTQIRILLADDHPVVRDGLRGMLAGEDGFQVVGEAASGAEAVAVCGRERPDVVLMDLQMPEMDGATATAEITARFPETRVLVLTPGGSSNADLFISEATVKTHLLHAFAKLGVDDRTAAVVAAQERGIIALPRRPP
jgi:CheY-like chemotaxis protein